jgi:3-polyprenyl-4-hydroxybenzoate decarboxylase
MSNVHDQDAVLFQLCANVRPAAGTSEFVQRPAGHPRPCGARLRRAAASSASTRRKKLPEEGQVRAWPPELDMSAEIKDLVTRRWSEYGL